MSNFKTPAGVVIPVRERREAVSSPFTAINAELVMPLNGDAYALVYVASTSFIGTLEFTGAMDGAATGYFPITAYPYSVGCSGGTIPLAGQPLLIDALVAANTVRVYAVPVGQLKALRVRASAYTSGSCVISITTDVNGSLMQILGAIKPSTLFVTQTAAVNLGVTATLPAVAGLRHYVEKIQVIRSATAALTAAATPVLVTTTNLPGAPVLTFGSDAGGVGVDIVREFSIGGDGLSATALGTATTVVCPVYTGVVWRVNVCYKLGI